MISEGSLCSESTHFWKGVYVRPPQPIVDDTRLTKYVVEFVMCTENLYEKDQATLSVRASRRSRPATPRASAYVMSG